MTWLAPFHAHRTELRMESVDARTRHERVTASHRTESGGRTTAVGDRPGGHPVLGADLTARTDRGDGSAATWRRAEDLPQ